MEDTSRSYLNALYAAGIQVIVRPYPRVECAWHRKKRIAKKWRKQRGPRYDYGSVNVREILYNKQQGMLYCYPAMETAIRQLLKEGLL